MEEARLAYVFNTALFKTLANSPSTLPTTKHEAPQARNRLSKQPDRELFGSPVSSLVSIVVAAFIAHAVLAFTGVGSHACAATLIH